MNNNKKNMETTAGSVETKKKEKTFTRDEVNKIVNAETNKAIEKYKEQVKVEKEKIYENFQCQLDMKILLKN